MKTKAEISVVLLQTKARQRLPANLQELGQRHGMDSPSRPSEGANPVDTWILDFWPPELYKIAVVLPRSL